MEGMWVWICGYVKLDVWVWVAYPYLVSHTHISSHTYPHIYVSDLMCGMGWGFLGEPQMVDKAVVGRKMLTDVRSVPPVHILFC